MLRQPLIARHLLGALLLLPTSAWSQAAAPDTPPQPAPTPPAVAEPPARSPEPEQPEPESPAPTPAPPEDPSAAPAAPPEAGKEEPSSEAPPAGEPAPAVPEPPAAPAPTSEATATPQAPPPDEEVEVSVLGSKSSHAAGSVHVIREDQLERFEYDDVAIAVAQVPGVYIRQEDGIGLRPNIGIRGANPDRSKKLTLSEDGVLFGPAPYSAPAAYFFPLLTRMTQINVVKGPSAIAHGPQTVGGAIDLISRPIPTTTTGRIDLALGEFGYNKGHAYFGTSNDQFGFLVEGVRLQNTGFMQLPTGADTGSTRNEWMFKASYLVDPRAEVSNQFLFKFTYTDEVSNETYLGKSDEDFREDPYRRYPSSQLDQMNNHRTGLSLTHLLESYKSPLKLKTTLYRNDYHRIWKKLNRLGGSGISDVLANPDDPANQGYYGVLTGEIDSGSPADYLWVGPNDRAFVSQGLQSVLTADAKTGPFQHKVEGGLRLHNDSIRRRHTEDAYLMQGGALVYAGEGTLTTAYNKDETFAGAVYVTDAVSYGPLTVTPGIRTELIWSETDDYLVEENASRFVAAVMPGAGAYYEIIPDLGALAGVYRGFSPPAPGADQTVSPEYSVNYEAGARYSKGRTRLEAIGFYNDYQNMTDVCTLASGCIDDNLDRQFDAGKARIYGIEAFVSHEQKLPLGFTLPTTIAYTFSQGQFQNSFESQDPIYGDVTAGDEIPYLPPHQLSWTLALEHRYGGINGAFNYVARMREVAGSGQLDDAWATDEQVWLDMGVFGRPLPWLTIYANLRNVTGEANLVSRRPYGARVNAPRWFQVGAKAEF